MSEVDKHRATRAQSVEAAALVGDDQWWSGLERLEKLYVHAYRRRFGKNPDVGRTFDLAFLAKCAEDTGARVLDWLDKEFPEDDTEPARTGS